MMGELKRSLKLLKYEKNVRSSLVVAAVFLALGIFIILCAKTPFMGGFYIFMTQLLVVGTVPPLLQSSMILSAPCRRFLETWLLDLLQLVGVLVCYGIVVLLVVIQTSANPELAYQYRMELVLLGATVAAMVVYMGIFHKMLVLGTVLFIVTFFLCFSESIHIAIPETMGQSVGIGFLLILAGLLAAAVLRRMLYRKPLTKGAFVTNL